MSQLVAILSVWRNPLFIRYARSRLRIRKSIFWYLFTLIITTFTVTLMYLIRTNSGVDEQDAARSLWIPILIIQGLVLMVKGTGSVSAGLIQDKIDATLDYQRLTPLKPIENVFGYLFGLPVLEYVMVLITVPHLLFVVFVGDIPLGVVLGVYSAFFLCVIMYHMTGIAAGMVMRKWVWGYLLSIFLVVFVNMILPTFISQLGLKFFQYLSVWPVIGQMVLPLMVPPGLLEQASSQNPYFSMADAVPFFNWSFSPYTFTILLQGVLVTTFSVMALRRWKSSTRHSLSKIYALAFLCGFIVLILGNLWPALTRQFLPFAIFGELDIEDIADALAIAVPLIYCLFVWTLCFTLFSMVIPDHHAYVRGIRRALKLGRDSARPWEDDSGSLSFMALFTVVSVSGFYVMFSALEQSGFFDFIRAAGFGLSRLPVALALVVFYTSLLIQVAQLRPTVLVVLLVWFLPILVAAVLAAARQDLSSIQTVIASISPLALLVMSGVAPLSAVSPDMLDNEFVSLMTGIGSGFVFIGIQIAYLFYRWQVLRHEYAAASRTQAPPEALSPAGA